MHPDNTLNEMPGDEWLYFTKSLWTTAYPSELGHAARKAHGANKPPRLMAKLIEFFTKPGELWRFIKVPLRELAEETRRARAFDRRFSRNEIGPSDGQTGHRLVGVFETTSLRRVLEGDNSPGDRRWAGPRWH